MLCIGRKNVKEEKKTPETALFSSEKWNLLLIK